MSKPLGSALAALSAEMNGILGSHITALELTHFPPPINI
jgi:hypothetical protein